MGRIGDGARFPDSGVWNVRDAFAYLVAPLIVPSVVQTAAVWLDAADLSTITESGGDVSQWNNKGTLGNFTQATAASQPTTGVGTLNGLNVINFASDFMISADTAATYKFLHDGTDYLVAAVWKPGVVDNPGVRYALYGNTNTTAEVGASLKFEDISPQNDVLRADVFNASGDSSTVPVFARTANDFIDANNFHVTTVLLDPNNATAANRYKAFNNGGSASTPNTNTGTVSGSNPSNVLRLGQENGSNTLTGSIAELVIVSGANAIEGNRVIIRDYLNAKWGVF